MPLPPPAEIGNSIDDVDTPALIVDLDAFETNVQRMADACAGMGVRHRAHAKTHKCPEIARRQIAAGAIGVCCQKVGEAEAMVAGGINDVLITNQIVGPGKLARLAELATKARIGVCVDDMDNVHALSEAASNAGATLDVLVEIDVGAGRCGVAPGAPARDLALRVANAKNLNFRGLQAYHGSAQHIRDAAERKAAIDGVVARVEGTLDLLGREGLAAADVTGAGTGSFIYEGTSGVYTEVQCGSYIFMDNDYAENKQDDGRPFNSFQHSLFALVSAISVAKPGHVVVDAGHKALGNDQGMPRVLDLPGAVYARPSDEHGTITLAQANPRVGLGQKLRLIPGHCDPTVNLHDWLVVVQHGVVVDLWEITARGAMR